MSAYLASNDTLSALITYWERSASHGNYTTPLDQLTRAHAAASDRAGNGWNNYQADADARDLMREHGGSVTAAAFALLVAENVRSLQARYPGSPDMWDSAELYKFKPSAAVQRWMNYAPLGQGNLVQMASSYAYQACEHDGWERSPAFQLIEQIRGFLLRDLEHRDCKDSHHGASFEEPEDPREVAMHKALSGRASSNPYLVSLYEVACSTPPRA